jgi:diguanylate cyclase (GGDEF)-like protein
MTLQVPRLRGGRPTAERAFALYVGLTTATALAILGPLAPNIDWRIDAPALFWLLSALVLVGELLPIPVPRRQGLAKVTISTAFAFAILLRFGLWPALFVYVGSVVIAQCVEHVAPMRALFNASQYALAMAAAAGVLALAGAQPPLISITGGQIGAVVAAGAAFFIVNHVLACVGAALLAGLSIPRYIRDDLKFQAWTAGCVLAFAPAVVASGHAALALVPLCFVPLLAVYVGGRQASLNSHRAYHDALTDLPNRVLFSETVGAKLAVAEHERRSLAVMLLDVDDFKAVNDTLGHEFGDVVLKHIGHRLHEAIGDRGMLARLGGDEFAVLVEDDPAAAEEVAQELVTALDLPMDIDSLAIRASASIGIACFPQHGRTVRQLLRHADVALYCAKASDDSFQLYAEEYDQYSIDRLALAAQLRRGIERGELAVHYQPKAPLDGSGTSAVEALVRWNHPQLGWIQPDGFIPLAEQTGVIKPLTRRVLESALAQCARWRSEGIQVAVSVNVSARDVLDHSLPATIRDLFESYQLPASVLQLEITESRIVADLRRARTALDELRGMGVRIAIDDFGTGFSSLLQLQQLPIDEIKIDRSFVTGMERNPGDAVMVRSVIDLGHSLGLLVTAEGVETEDVQRKLRRLRCDFAQGFHIGRPAPADECRQYLDVPTPPAPLTLAAGVAKGAA